MAKDVVIRNVDYDDVPFVKIPIQDSAEEAYFWDTSDATLTNGNQMLAGYSGYGAGGVKVDGSIPAKSSADLTASGATVTVPAGNYAEQATKSVASGSATPAASISATGATVTPGTNTLKLSKSVSNTPQVSAGYVSSGTAGNSNVELTASVPTKAAATITPGTTDQEIASGTYLTGKQTIKGDSNLVASKIVYPNTIFGVQGSAQLPVISQDSTTHGLAIS